ncbi:CvpA family protein [Pseudochryseolinea flava]|uniref:CvpA family protein n=1 Tax=Pseudochryseolinea flava TaxID=2059302 RepID=UPI001403ECFA|nr:CvpA family protein [Pseudochryseolinea flava]
MSKVDLILALIICAGAYGGFKDGFILELISFFAIVIGVFAGFKLMAWGMVYLEREFVVDPNAAPYIAFGAVFFSVIFLANLLSKLIRPRFEKPMLGIVDQSVGAAIGFVKTAFMLSILLWLFTSMKFYFPDGWVKGSWLLPFIADLAPGTTHWLATFIPFFEGLF